MLEEADKDDATIGKNWTSLGGEKKNLGKSYVTISSLTHNT